MRIGIRLQLGSENGKKRLTNLPASGRKPGKGRLRRRNSVRKDVT